MRWGVWTPLPATVQTEPALEAGTRQLKCHGGAGEPDLSFAFARDVLQRGESYGFDLTLVAQRFLGPDPDCIVMASALAAHTSKMHVMPAVHPGIMTPHVVAKMMTTLDRLSGGRSALNIITGWFREEFELFSNGAYIEDEASRYRRIDEYVQVLKGLWSEQTFSFDGKFYNFRDASLPNRPAQVPHPPLYTATRNELGKDTTARHCDVWFVPVQPGVDSYESNFTTIARDVEDMQRRAARHGRQLKFAIGCYVVCEASNEAAYQRALEFEGRGTDNKLAFISARGLGAGLVGTPERIAQRLRRYEDIGVDITMLHYKPMLAGLDRFAAEVMPLMQPSRAKETADAAAATH